jgi:hypothetical protein
MAKILDWIHADGRCRLGWEIEGQSADPLQPRTSQP